MRRRKGGKRWGRIEASSQRVKNQGDLKCKFAERKIRGEKRTKRRKKIKKYQSPGQEKSQVGKETFRLAEKKGLLRGRGGNKGVTE